MQLSDIKPNLMVHARPQELHGAADSGLGIRIGTVDHIEGDRFIELRIPYAGLGKRRLIPLSWVEDVDDKAVYLRKTVEEVCREAPEPSGAAHA